MLPPLAVSLAKNVGLFNIAVLFIALDEFHSNRCSFYQAGHQRLFTGVVQVEPLSVGTTNEFFFLSLPLKICSRNQIRG